MPVNRNKYLDLVCDECGFSRPIEGHEKTTWRQLEQDARAEGWTIGRKSTGTCLCRRCKGAGHGQAETER